MQNQFIAMLRRSPLRTPLFAQAAATINHLVAAVFPSQCLMCACSLKGELLCANCEYDLPHNYGKFCCRQCGLRIEGLSHFCGNCLRHPPEFSRAFVPFSYEYPLDALIHNFKYRANLTCGRLLAQMLTDAIKHQTVEDDEWELPDLIIPVPLHWQRRWLRGFNQAQILAAHIGRELGIPTSHTLVQRKHKTPPQKGLSRRARQKNLRHSFTIPTNRQPEINGKRIALVDDVVTTTATARELSKMLKAAGAAHIEVWALARTPQPSPPM